MKKILAIALIVVVSSLVATPAHAWHFDFGFVGSDHYVDVSAGVEKFDLAILLKSWGNREAGQSYSEMGFGYKIGSFTPFMGWGIQDISPETTESGVVVGVTFGTKINQVGIHATLAKAPDSLYGDAKARYYINDNFTLIGGYLYHPSASGVVIGLGVSY